MAISNNLSKTANLLNASNITYLISRDSVQANMNLQIIRSDKLIEHAILFDADDDVFASYQDDLTKLNTQSYKEGIHFEKNIVYLLQKIHINQILQGHLLIIRSTEDLRSLITKQIFVCFLIFLIGLSLTYLLSLYLKKRITQPITKLAAASQKIVNNKSYDARFNITQKDEIGSLFKSFNKMLSAVQTRETELKQHNEHLEKMVEMRTGQLQHRANHDALTQLPNRYLLMEKLNQGIANAKRHDSLLAILLIDLDRFKIINDSLGHAIGDKLLQEVAARLKGLARESDCIRRLGGDEFVIMLSKISNNEDAKLVAEKIIHQLTLPFHIDNHSLQIGASIGISIFPNDGEDARMLLQHADISMYQSKSVPSSSYEFFEKKMDTTHQRLLLEKNLRKALAEDKFTILYQPKINATDKRIAGMEALIRWTDSILGEVSPAYFIPIADEMGLLNDITKWVLETTCLQQKKWQDEGLQNNKIAVNISANHLVSADIYSLIKNTLDKFELKGEDLEIEITEDVFIGHTERNSEILKRIKSLGVTIAIDDFGTGYSSLSYLQNFPFDSIKLDTSFTKRVNHCPKSRGIVASTILLAHSLDLEITAEGVEDHIQFDFLKKNKCDLIQGFYFSRPISAKSITKLLRQQ